MKKIRTIELDGKTIKLQIVSATKTDAHARALLSPVKVSSAYIHTFARIYSGIQLGKNDSALLLQVTTVVPTASLSYAIANTVFSGMLNADLT